jgi:hypothetical protein
LTLSRENRVSRRGTSHDGFFLPGGLNFDLLRNQFPDADHFLTVIGEAWLRRNKPPHDGNKAFELRHKKSLRCSALLIPSRLNISAEMELLRLRTSISATGMSGLGQEETFVPALAIADILAVILHRERGRHSLLSPD